MSSQKGWFGNIALFREEEYDPGSYNVFTPQRHDDITCARSGCNQQWLSSHLPMWSGLVRHLLV